MMYRSIYPVALAGVLLSTAASAQEQVFRSVNVAQGASTRVGIHGNVSKECAAGPLPEIKIVTAPKNGTLTVNSGKSKAGALNRCPNLEVPARAVFYKANARYSGPDEVTYEVKRPDGRNQSVTVKITVGGAAGKPDAKRTEGGVDL